MWSGELDPASSVHSSAPPFPSLPFSPTSPSAMETVHALQVAPVICAKCEALDTKVKKLERSRGQINKDIADMMKEVQEWRRRLESSPSSSDRQALQRPPAAGRRQGEDSDEALEEGTLEEEDEDDDEDEEEEEEEAALPLGIIDVMGGIAAAVEPQAPPATVAATAAATVAATAAATAAASQGEVPARILADLPPTPPPPPPPGLGIPVPAAAELPQLSVTEQSKDGGRISHLVKWRIDRVETKFRDCVGRPLVSQQFEVHVKDQIDLTELRLMVFPNLGVDLSGKTMKEQKAQYEDKIAKGPLTGALKLKVVTTIAGKLVVKFKLFVGGTWQGPISHDFSDRIIHGCDFNNNWREDMDGGSLTVGVEILAVNDSDDGLDGAGRAEASGGGQEAPPAHRLPPGLQ